MKIREMTVVPLTAPYVHVHVPKDHPGNGVRNCLWVRIDTDEGVSGWGEAYWGCYATEVSMAAFQRFRRSLIGKDALDPSSTLAEMRFANRYWGMRGLGAQCTSAIEAALWDIVGQVKKLPLWQLLGDGKLHPVLLYASAGLATASPQQIHDQVKAFVQHGYRAYKMRCGGRLTDAKGCLAIDNERVAAAREALGPDRLLFVDVAAPQRPATWDYACAASYIQALHPYQVRFIEEPAMTYDVATYRKLQDLHLIPTAGGESFACPEEFEPFFAAGALGVAQPDAAVVGGPASCVEVIRRARQHGVPVAIHAWSAGVGLAQNLHAACSLDGVLTMEGPSAIHPLASEPVREIWHCKDGYLMPPTRPGLGVSITAELLEKYNYQSDSERDY